jgi:hypothetical protein
MGGFVGSACNTPLGKGRAVKKCGCGGPNDLDLAFEYAKLSADAGDYEGAISTMERMLIYAPNTPRIQFELGVLYYRLGAYDVSRSYFEQVLANPSVPPDVANQVRLYIQQLSLAADPPPFSASIFSAIRYETNANFGPGTNSVTLNGIDFTLDDQSVGKPGWSALNIGTLHYSYDLKKQGDKLEFDFLAYSTAYFDNDLTDIDLDFFEFTLGPSWSLKRWGWGQTRLYTYAIADLAYLGYDTYFTAPGAGIRLLSFSAERSVLDARWGRSFGTKLYKIKGSVWPFYYGIQPTGRYPDEPFVRELYYNGANPIILHRVPEPRIPEPEIRVRVPDPTPPPPNTPPILTNVPGFTDKVP